MCVCVLHCILTITPMCVVYLRTVIITAKGVEFPSQACPASLSEGSCDWLQLLHDPYLMSKYT